MKKCKDSSATEDIHLNEHKNADNEIPIILTSSASCSSDTDLLPINNNKSTIDLFNDSLRNGHSSYASTNSISSRKSFMRSPSPNNLNASTTSYGNVRRWSQSLTSGSKIKQQRPIHLMPSRLQKLPVARSMDSQFSSNEVDLDHFVQEIEQHDHLMEDSPTGEKQRLATLRALPQTLTMRKQIKTRINALIEQKSRQSSSNCWKNFANSFHTFNIKSQVFIKKTIKNAELWYESMKEIEGHFGNGVGTYFKFLRFLFVLNFISMMLISIFIVFPQMMRNIFQSADTGSSLMEFISYSNITNYVTAKGHLENSLLFYGFYSNKTNSFKIPYSIPHAYLVTMILLYVGLFIILSITMARSYRRSFIETSGGEPMDAHQIFCSWDCSISYAKAAEMKKQSIYNELRKIIDDLCDEYDDRNYWSKFWIITSQISSNLFVIGIYATLAFITIYLIRSHVNDAENTVENLTLFVPTAISILMILLQMLFEWLATLESYKSARTTLHITLIRSYLLEIVVISSLLWFWLSEQMKPNVKAYNKCWETAIGQEIYRFVIVDFLLVTCGGAMVHTIRYFIFKFVWTGFGLPELNISRGSLGLIFNQSLLWIGLFFSPLLAIVLFIKMVIVFHLKKFVLIKFCKPPSKLWRSAQNSTIFLAMTFVSLVCAIVVLAYVLTQIQVSSECGPFRSHKFMYNIFSGDITKIPKDNYLWKSIIFLIRPASIGGILLTLCVIVYYLRSKCQARIAMVKLLKHMVYLEARDKEYLLMNITRVTQGKGLVVEGTEKLNSFNRRIIYGMYKHPAAKQLCITLTRVDPSRATSSRANVSSTL